MTSTARAASSFTRLRSRATGIPLPRPCPSVTASVAPFRLRSASSRGLGALASAVKRAALNCSLTALDRVVVRGCWRIRCAESSTAQILQQIIQETTNRMNRLQQQESENEWQLLQIKGDIEEERAKTELLSVQVENSNARAAMDGLAEATRVQSFLQGIAADVPGAHVCLGRERERECVCV